MGLKDPGTFNDAAVAMGGIYIPTAELDADEVLARSRVRMFFVDDAGSEETIVSNVADVFFGGSGGGEDYDGGVGGVRGGGREEGDEAETTEGVDRVDEVGEAEGSGEIVEGDSAGRREVRGGSGEVECEAGRVGGEEGVIGGGLLLKLFELESWDGNGGCHLHGGGGDKGSGSHCGGCSRWHS